MSYTATDAFFHGAAMGMEFARREPIYELFQRWVRTSVRREKPPMYVVKLPEGATAEEMQAVDSALEMMKK